MLYFGAVDESCWVYVNRELAGEHIFEKDGDWRTPFEIDITPCLDREKAMQQGRRAGGGQGGHRRNLAAGVAGFQGEIGMLRGPIDCHPQLVPKG